MKCRICGKVANIELKAHNIALCRDDFINFFERRVRKTIEKYKLMIEKDKVLIAISGGKDSLALSLVLKRLGYDVSGIYINLGIHDYSDLSQIKCESFSKKYNVPIYVFSIKDFFEEDIKEIAKKMRRKSCSICGLIKRYVMNRVGYEKNFSVLATGHNLDDEVAQLFGNLLNFDLQRLSKEKIIMPSKEKTIKKVKPLSLITEKEIAAYAIMNGIDYVYDECPYSIGATSLTYKEALNSIEAKSAGTKLRFFKEFLSKQSLFFEDKTENDIKYCHNCGYLTYRNLCSFCLLAEKLSRFDKVRLNFLDYCKQL